MKNNIIVSLFIILFILSGPGGVFTSSFGVITVQSEMFLLQLGLNTGSMENPDDEEEEIEQWTSICTPIAEKLAAAINERLELFSNENTEFHFIDFNEEMPELWEESVSSSDIPNFLKKGNGECIYIMRFIPSFCGDTTLIKISFSSLPEREEREILKNYLLESIEHFRNNSGTIIPFF